MTAGGVTRAMTGPDWVGAVARLVSSSTVAGTTTALNEAIDAVVEHGGICLLAFHNAAPPEVLHHTLERAGKAHYVDRYLAGPYLLDPLYQLATQTVAPDVCRFRDEAPDRFMSSEYYRQYCERTHLKDELDFFRRIDSTLTLALVVGRRERRFSKAEVQVLQRAAPILNAAIEKIWRHAPSQSSRRSADDKMHQRLTECFENFGDGLLTDREQQITRLLLRGYSTKAIALELGIAPGTVMVHKRNLFTKLGISSQYELFSRFISSL